MPEDQAMTDKIEAYLDGELSELEARRIERRVAEDPSFADELDLALRIQSGLRSLELTCPPEVIAGVDEEIGRRGFLSRVFSETLAQILPQRLFDFSWLAAKHGGWRPAVATLAAALAMVAFFSVGLPEIDSPTDSTTPSSLPTGATSSIGSQSDVEAARREIELAFAYLGQLGRTAETSVRRLTTEASEQGDDAL